MRGPPRWRTSRGSVNGWATWEMRRWPRARGLCTEPSRWTSWLAASLDCLHFELALNICLLLGRSWDSTEIKGCSTGCYPGNLFFVLSTSFEKGWQKVILMYRCPARFFSRWSTGTIWALQSCPPGWRTTSSSSFTIGRLLSIEHG